MRIAVATFAWALVLAVALRRRRCCALCHLDRAFRRDLPRSVGEMPR